MLQVLSPTYKSRTSDFRRIFKDIPADERLIVGKFCTRTNIFLIFVPSNSDSFLLVRSNTENILRNHTNPHKH